MNTAAAPHDISAQPCALVVIGASIGGLHAFQKLLATLPADFPLPIAIIQHQPEESEPLSVPVLQRFCRLLVCEPEDREPIVPSRVYMAPAGYHLLVERGVFELSSDPPVLHSRPSIDVLFESAAQSYGEEALGILLTGASEDGARGLLAIRRSGGSTLVQDPATAEGKIMPAAALRLGAADRGYSLEELACILAGLRAALPAATPPTPAERVPTEGTPAEAPDIPTAERPSVLLVDDNPKNLTSLTAVLESPQWRIVPARSGEEALRRMLEPVDYALVVLDVRMPGLDGFDVVKLMKQHVRLSRTPVCFFTASLTERDLITRAYDAGVVDFLTKPVDPLLLRAKVSVFTELWRNTRELAAANRLLQEQSTKLAEAHAADARTLADRQRAEVERRVRSDALLYQQAALLDLARSRSSGLSTAFGRVCATAACTLGVTRASIWRFTPDHAELRCEQLHSAGAAAAPPDIPAVPMASCPRYFEALKGGRAIAADDALNDPRTRELAPDYLRPFGVSSLLDLPIYHRGLLHGLIRLEHTGPIRRWTEEEQGFVVALADHLALALETEERKRAEAAIRLAEERQRFVTDAARIGTWDWDIELDSVVCNDICRALFGAPPEEAMTYTRFLQALHPDDRARTDAAVQRCLSMGEPYAIDYRTVWPDGTEHWVHAKGCVQPSPDGHPQRMGGIVIDITERKQAEAAIRASLAEKEVLLREIHHRVKNNLQVVSGILGLQRAQLNDPKLESIFTEAEARVRSMALVHQRLYQEHTISSIEFASYLKSLAQDLVQQAVLPDGPQVRLELDLAEASIPVDTAIPLGLIANELVTNALKYAYRDRTEGVLRLSLQPAGEGRLELAVSDNGPGHSEGFDPATATSLGLQLVRMLAQQIGGTAQFLPGPGAPCRIHFPLQPPTLKTTT